MTKGQIQAYEEAKVYAATAQWEILVHLARHPGWRLAPAILPAIHRVSREGGLRPRLRELCDMGLVQMNEDAENRSGRKAVAYRITDRGRLLISRDNYGRWCLHAAGRKRAGLYEERADALRQEKLAWRKRTSDFMSLYMQEKIEEGIE